VHISADKRGESIDTAHMRAQHNFAEPDRAVGCKDPASGP